jgi:predicted RNase H-like HicB family nuclease
MYRFCTSLVGQRRPTWRVAYARSVQERAFEIILQPDPEDGFSVFVPELPSVVTQGETVEDAHVMAREAIEAYLEVMHEDGLPVPSARRGWVMVRAA